MNIDRAREILKSQFGYDSFRMNQHRAIETVLAKKDCVVLMPTGGGKSLCYQIPAIMFDGLTVVISPLIALMKDQVDALRQNGVEAAFLNSTQTTQQQVEIFRAVRSGYLKLLYIAPERLIQSGDQFLDFLKSINVSLFAIDEAHCISNWGHDFRPEYAQLSKLKRHFPDVPLIALTATADKLVKKDIVERLGIQNSELLVSSFNRPNIFYTVQPKRNSYSQLLDYLDQRKNESGIVYCLSRKSVDDLAEDLKDAGFDALPYHAGLDKETREKHQELFLKDETKIIVATIAFGMGIDKSNVRFVVHCDLPKNIESYYQETGRAGRDGLPSDALLFFSWGDVVKLKGFAEVEGNAAQSEIMLNKLDIMGKFGDLKTCRRKFLLNYFSEEADEDCGSCDNCTTVFEKFDGTIIAQKALSAVMRLGESFGLTYTIDLLRGSAAKSIRDEHKNLKTYGVGADISKDHWFEYFKDLIAQGYLAQSPGQYPVLILTEKSRSVLKGETKVELFKLREKDERMTAAVRETAHPYFQDLFDELRQIRTNFAKNENVPPYVIFSDVTLTEMATFLPVKVEDIRKISGVGDLKLQKYGAHFLDRVIQYCQENALESRMELKAAKRERKSRPKGHKDGTDTFSISLNMFRDGISVAEIARQRSLGVTTIESHLARFVASGDLMLTDVVDEKKIEPIREAIASMPGNLALSPVKEILGDSYSYGEIRAVMAAG